MNIDELQLHELLADTIAQVRDRAKLKEIRIVEDIGMDIRIRGDKEKLVIALLNIMVNAVEAMTEKTGVLNIRASVNKNLAEISINDNGSGIPQQDINKLFEPFFTSKRGGTGLGLTATYTIISKHDGSLKVSSELNKGTQFTVFLPAATGLSLN